MKEIGYDRARALAYAEKWALSRNPAYFNFGGLGGDCTNFISQCLYAGCGVMNYAPVYGWYYISPDRRAPSWTGVEFLHRFLVGNKGAGPYGAAAGRGGALPGDVAQLGGADGLFYHSLLIVAVSGGELYVATHSYDAYMRPLSSYAYEKIRYIHIQGARRY